MNGRENVSNFSKQPLVYKIKLMFYENKTINFNKSKDNYKCEIGYLPKR